VRYRRDGDHESRWPTLGVSQHRNIPAFAAASEGDTGVNASLFACEGGVTTVEAVRHLAVQDPNALGKDQRFSVLRVLWLWFLKRADDSRRRYHLVRLRVKPFETACEGLFRDRCKPDLFAVGYEVDEK